jgi:hypothetical protein
VIVADVADCYPSIGDGAIRAAAATVGGDPEPLLRILDRIHDGGVEGVPIGPAASVAIADAVLAIADACARTAGADPIRWVDDVMFVGDRADVERAASAWRSALKELGLAEQEEKRQMFDDAHLAEVTILPRPSLWR